MLRDATSVEPLTSSPVKVFRNGY